MNSTSSLRQVSRDAVRDRIAEVALGLFAEHGFERTTVEEIARAVGTSERTFFRYFATKDEVVLLPYEHAYAQMLTLLGERPLEEDVWETLTVVCAHSIRALLMGPYETGRVQRLQRIIGDSPVLLAAYLRQFDRLQERLTDALVQRQERRAPGREADRVVARALVGASFAHLHAVVSAARSAEDVARADERFAALMQDLRPRSLPAGS